MQRDIAAAATGTEIDEAVGHAAAVDKIRNEGNALLLKCVDGGGRKWR